MAIEFLKNYIRYGQVPRLKSNIKRGHAFVFKDKVFSMTLS